MEHLSCFLGDSAIIGVVPVRQRDLHASHGSADARAFYADQVVPNTSRHRPQDRNYLYRTLRAQLSTFNSPCTLQHHKGVGHGEVPQRSLGQRPRDGLSGEALAVEPGGISRFGI